MQWELTFHFFFSVHWKWIWLWCSLFHISLMIAFAHPLTSWTSHISLSSAPFPTLCSEFHFYGRLFPICICFVRNCFKFEFKFGETFETRKSFDWVSTNFSHFLTFYFSHALIYYIFLTYCCNSKNSDRYLAYDWKYSFWRIGMALKNSNHSMRCIKNVELTCFKRSIRHLVL